MTPSEELRAAAAKLRKSAEEAVARPAGWESEHAHTGRWHASSDIVVNDDNEPVAASYGPCPWPEAAWIALTSPVIAEPLAAVLEWQAHWVGWASSWDQNVDEAWLHLRDLAQHILGGGSQ